MTAMKTHFQTHTSWSVAAGSFPLIVLLLCAEFSTRAETFKGDVTRFSPTSGQPVFPAGNVNAFKQMVVGFDVSERVGKSTEVDLLLDKVEFGGELSGRVHATFGFEVGLCFGGNTDFDLAFQPTVTLPDQYPFEVALPLTVSEGMLPDSHFTTTFPPLGKAYADFIFDMGAQLKAKACVFGCFDALDFSFSTCDLPPLPTSAGPVYLFNESKRCDPSLLTNAYCSIELASFNRNDDSKLRLLNLKATNSLDFITKPYLEFALSNNTSFPVGSGTNGPLKGKYGSLSMSPRTIATDSRRSTSDPYEKAFSADPGLDRLLVSAVPGFRSGQKVMVSSQGKLPKGLNSACLYYVVNPVIGAYLQLATKPGGPPVDILDGGVGTHRIFVTEASGSAAVLKSKGAEDILGLGINFAEMAKDFMFPSPPPPAPQTPALADSGSVGPVEWNYVLAGLDAGPAVQLQTEFEMTWHLEVTGITFREPGTTNARPVKINGQVVTDLNQVTPAKIYHLRNSGDNALPQVTLLNTLPVEVDISYVLKPNLKTVVSTPFIGSIKYKALGAGASIERVGELRFGPLIEGEHKFKAGEFNVYKGDPSPIQSGAPRSEYASPKDLERYDLWLFQNTPANAVPGAGCAVVIISELGGVLSIRIFDPSGARVVDGLASSLLASQTLADLTSKLSPFPLSEDSLLPSEKEQILEDATALANYTPGHLKFIMKAAGPPSFDWRPSQLGGNSDGNWTQEYLLGGGPLKTTNWRELLANATNSFPGKEGPSSFAQITNGLPHPTLTNSERIATLKIGTGRQLFVTLPSGGFPPKLIVEGGMVENNGTINVDGYVASFPGDFSTLRLNSTNAVLCGTGAVRLINNARLEGPRGVEPFTFFNYNTISGAGDAMNQYGVNPYKLIHYWDFDRSLADTTEDVVNGVQGKLLNGAVISTAGGGHAGVSGALSLGSGNTDTMQVADTARLNRALAGDKLTVTFWQKLNTVLYATTFKGQSPSAINPGDPLDLRGISVHTPWGNLDQVIYFDTAGCCDDTKRINSSPQTSVNFLQWHHFAFVKDGATKQIWLDGFLLAQGNNIEPLPADFTSLWVGSGINGAESINGFLDDFAIFAMALPASVIYQLGHDHTRPDALNVYVPSESVSTIKNLGTFRSDAGYLTTSANRIVNQGVLESLSNSRYYLFGDQFESLAGSRVSADGPAAQIYLSSFDTVEHAGLVRASQGGIVNVSYSYESRMAWHAGQSVTKDVGLFRAEGAGSLLHFYNTDMNGGSFSFVGGGSLEAYDTDFTGADFHIGDFDTNGVNAASGFLTLTGATTRVLSKVSLDNYGTVNVSGQVEFRETVHFANNGTVQVPTDGSLRIHEVTNQTPSAGAATNTLSQPGTANASAESLVGGTWDIAGTLLIDGASFASLGANAARASTGSGSRDTLGVTAQDSESDLTRVLSLGNPAKVILRGANWSFPALTTLNENRGSLWLVQGSAFPGTLSSTPGAFTNKGELHLESGSQLSVGGSFVQTGPQAKTDLTNATLTSAIQNYQILGGRVTATAASTLFNRSGNTILGGTTIRVESPLDTGKTNFFGELVFEQHPVIVSPGAGVQINTIALGANVTLHGAAVQFPALTDNLRWNAGTFTVSGDGWDNAGGFRIGQGSTEVLTNTGLVNLLGFRTELSVGKYIQSGVSAATRIGAGATLTVFGDLANSGGEIVVEIASRPREGQVGMISAGSSADFGNKLVIEFTGKLAGPSYSVDLGDTWEIVSRTSSATLTGTNNVAYRLNGAPLPAGWLPAGSHLAVIRFNTEFGPRGLGIRVVPDSGFTEYGPWAAASGFPTNQLSNPYRDLNTNGVLNGLEFLFGVNAAGRVAPAQIRHVLGADGRTYTELSYTRPSEHPNAIYTPYYSMNLVNWYPAAMAIAGISPGPGPNQETVTLRSEFPDSGAPMAFRIQADFVTDNLDAGLIPDKPLHGFNVLNNINTTIVDKGYSVSYTVEPGLELFFSLNNVQATVYGTGRYREWSSLPQAAVHAGVVPEASGVVKVIFLSGLYSYVGSNTNGVQSQNFTQLNPGDETNELSFRIEANPGPLVLNAVPVVPPPIITNIVRTNNAVLMQWTGPTNAQYQVQWKPTITTPAWNSFTNFITSPTGQFSFLDNGTQTSGLGATRFYRLVQLP